MSGDNRTAGSLWSYEEDLILLRHVSVYGTRHWARLQDSGALPHRDQKACCNRFILLKRKYLRAHGRAPTLPASNRGNPQVTSSLSYVTSPARLVASQDSFKQISAGALSGLKDRGERSSALTGNENFSGGHSLDSCPAAIQVEPTLGEGAVEPIPFPAADLSLASLERKSSKHASLGKGEVAVNHTSAVPASFGQTNQDGGLKVSLQHKRGEFMAWHSPPQGSPSLEPLQWGSSSAAARTPRQAPSSLQAYPVTGAAAAAGTVRVAEGTIKRHLGSTRGHTFQETGTVLNLVSSFPAGVPSEGDTGVNFEPAQAQVQAQAEGVPCPTAAVTSAPLAFPAPFLDNFNQGSYSSQTSRMHSGLCPGAHASSHLPLLDSLAPSRDSLDQPRSDILFPPSKRILASPSHVAMPSPSHDSSGAPPPDTTDALDPARNLSPDALLDWIATAPAQALFGGEG